MGSSALCTDAIFDNADYAKASCKRKDYETALVRARQEGILLTTYEVVLLELPEAAGIPDSKAVQKIVKQQSAVLCRNHMLPAHSRAEQRHPLRRLDLRRGC